MSQVQILSSRHLNKGGKKGNFKGPEILTPKSLPVLPTPSELEASGDAEKAFTAYEKAFYATLDENNMRFDKAMRRIKLCALLQSFQHAFDLTPYNIHQNHYSWCPATEWAPEINLETHA